MTALHRQLKDIQRDTSTDAIAFFDLDRTLIAGYSVAAMAREALRGGLRRQPVARAAQIMQDQLRRKPGQRGASYHRLVRQVAEALKDVPEQSLRDLGDSAWRNSVAASLFSEAVSLVEAHRAAGHHLVIVSAASPYQVEPVARVLGIEDICCTRLEVSGGRFTGRVREPLCYGEGKLMAARAVVRRRRSAMARSYFYSDSSDDLPLLRKVGRPVAVNPSERLREVAEQAQWPVLDFASRGGSLPVNAARTVLALQGLALSTAVGALHKQLGMNHRTSANRLTRLLGDLGAGLAGIDIEVEGGDILQRRRPAVFVFNHQSMLDALVLARLLREDVVGLCKLEMQDKPLLGPLLKQVDTIFVDRADRDQSTVLQRALQVLADGRSLVIAPEGPRSTLGGIQPFKHGAFLLAKKAKVPIVPIVLHNVKDALPKGGLLIRPATVRVSVLQPIEPGDIRSVRGASAELEARYCELLCRSSAAALPWQARAA